MAIDKSLSQAPMGLEELAAVATGEPTIEVEIELEPGEAAEVEIEEQPAFEANLAETLDESVLSSMAEDLVAQVDEDIASRKDWVETFVKGLEVLGLKYEDRTEPWAGACGVYSTVLIEAAIRFQSETIMETFPASGPVKTEIVGAIDRLKEEAATRVREDMNYQITQRMSEYRPEHERLLFNLGLAGAAFKKVYFDPTLDRQTAVFVPAEDVIIPYGASSSATAERVTHVMRKTKNDVKKLQEAGFYRDVDLGEPEHTQTDVEKRKAEEQGYSLTQDDRYQFLEIQVELNLPGDSEEGDVALPYVVTIDRSTKQVLSVYRNWREEDPKHLKRQHFIQYTYIPGFGAYGLGLIHLIGGYARAGTSIVRELVDAGQLSNLPGGLKSKGLRIKGDDTPIAPGEFRDVDVASGTVRDNIMPLPYKEPSQVLLALLNQLTEEARRLGAISDMNISDMSANAPVGTTLALLERTLKTMSAVQARVHYSMKQEFKLLAEIIRDHAPEEYDYTPDFTENRGAKRGDYSMVEVIPVSDPNSSTMAQRIMQYQAALQMAQQAPQIYDLPILHRQMLEVLGIKNAAKLVPIEDDMTPRDPISENMAILTGKPVKAFIYQDHDAHIAAHTTFMQDPMIAQQMGQNPMAQQMQAAAMAHIAEHLAFAYRKKIEERLGAPLPVPNAELPEEMEVQLSRLVAQASVQLLQINQQAAAAQQAQAAAQDPVIQMQQQELAIKAQEAQTKAKKVDGELMLKQAELQLKAREGGENPEAVAAAQQVEQGLDVMRAQNEERRADERHQQNLRHADEKHNVAVATTLHKARQTPAQGKPPKGGNE